MSQTIYPQAVAQLLTLGSATSEEDWLDYRQMGIQEEHIPDLIHMATDMHLNMADLTSDEVWAPMHAWRALGELKAQAASEPLTVLFDEMFEDEWAASELPEVYGMIGAAAIPDLDAYLQDGSISHGGRMLATDCLAEVAAEDEAAREPAIKIFHKLLEKYREHNPLFNGSLVYHLVELGAWESLPLIEGAFAAGQVDESIIDMDEVEDAANFDLDGLAPLLLDPEDLPLLPPISTPFHHSKRNSSSQKKAKQKRKQAQKTRKQQRKRKK
ncbi:MAG: DUF1186 domain-containing protein [Chloroflexi bacterium]|nr:DUF1186 domain-containing protein [Chloroflexota bacterium]